MGMLFYITYGQNTSQRSNSNWMQTNEWNKIEIELEFLRRSSRFETYLLWIIC